MVIGPRDLRSSWRFVARALGSSGPPPQKDAKYSPLQKLFHMLVAAVVLAIVATGLLMLSKIDTPFWRRNPYWLADAQWGMIYAIHGLCAMGMITLIMAHVYFAVRPEKLWMTRSMFSGWITRDDYLRHHDPQRWPVPMRRQPEVTVAARRIPPASEIPFEGKPMTEPGDASPMSLPERIEAIEQAYELMLAYAAQGRQNDTDDSSSIRRFLQRADAALDGLTACLAETVADALRYLRRFHPGARSGRTAHACGSASGAGAEGAELAAHRQSQRIDPHPRAADRYFPDRREPERKRCRWLISPGPGSA